MRRLRCYHFVWLATVGLVYVLVREHDPLRARPRPIPVIADTVDEAEPDFRGGQNGVDESTTLVYKIYYDQRDPMDPKLWYENYSSTFSALHAR